MTANKPMITIPTKKATYFKGLVVVIDSESSRKFIFMSFTDETPMILTFKKLVVLLKGYAI